MKVNILGTIVSADYDCDQFASWINRGVITPSSRVVSALDTADEPVELYISSYGGDVFAGGEMMIALLIAQAAGKLKSVEVGSIAASMAANIVASLRAYGVKVSGHANSQLMFHGCYTSTEGGAQHHEDVAESLRNINEAVIADLNAIGIKECRAWFAEGREKWMSAGEAKDLGLFTDVVGDDCRKTETGKRTASRLAAFASKFVGRVEYSMELDEQIAADAEQVPTETAEPVEAAVEIPAPVEAPEMVTLAECEKRIAGLQAAKDREIAELKKQNLELAEIHSTDQKSLAEANAAAISQKERAEKVEQELAEMRAAYEIEKQNREAVVTSALDAPAPVAKNAKEVLASLPMSKREAFYKAHANELK